jgi:coenzyme F420 biosynthesis associated uncharacterized protein
VSWDAADRVAGWVVAYNRRSSGAGGASSLDLATEAELERDFEEVTALAETLVVGATGLVPLQGAARAQVVDRATWAHANLATFRGLLDPVLDRLGAPKLPGPLATASAAAAGAQVGAILGWMSSRVLGQYDPLGAGKADGDLISYVGPNVVSLERRYGFPARELRLWIALHEVTHRCQFTGVPWLRGHFLSLVQEALDMVPPDPKRLAESLRRVAASVRAGRDPFGEAGVLSLVVAPEQLEVMGRIQAMMSLLEGHGDVTMDRAGADLVPEADRFSRILRARRHAGGWSARLVQRLVGLEAKLRQYEQGEDFVRAVESAGGQDLFNRVWTGPEWLPTMEEIRSPEIWLGRATAVSPAGR